MATQIWVHITDWSLDGGELRQEIPVVDMASAELVSARWETAGFDTRIVTCPDHP
jgi:hypothetical protein